MLGLAALELASQASILVVEAGGGLIGFSVAALLSIDDVPRAKLLSAPPGVPAEHAISTHFFTGWRHIKVGTNSGEKILGVLNLDEVATLLLG